MTALCPTCNLDFYAEPVCRCGVDWEAQREINARGKALALAHMQRTEATMEEKA